MSDQRLTEPEMRLLERHHDGALGEGERERAERLLGQVSEARQFSIGLGEVRVAVLGAERALWERGDAPGSAYLSAQVLERAERASELEELAGREFKELEPMLLRYHDGERVAEEAALIEALSEQREDVALYLTGLCEIGLSVQGAAKEALDGIDFGELWSRLEGELEAPKTKREASFSSSSKVLAFPKATQERPAFNHDDHRVLLYRYHDGVASEQERAQVEAWREIDDHVEATLEVLGELKLAAQAAMELAEEHIEPGLIWSKIKDDLRGRDEPQQVVALSAHRAMKEPAAASSTGNHRREIFIALAAVLCTVLGVALLGDTQLFGERVVVEKTVVIVDSLEYGNGTSVMVTGSMQTASMDVAGKKAQADVEERGGPASEEEEEITPTVIWLIDPDLPQDKGEGEQTEERSKKGKSI